MWKTNEGKIIEGKRIRRFMDQSKIRIMDLSDKEYGEIIDGRKRIIKEGNYRGGLIYEIITYGWAKEGDRGKIIQFPTVIQNIILEYVNENNIKMLLKVNESEVKMLIGFRQKRTCTKMAHIKNNIMGEIDVPSKSDKSIAVLFKKPFSIFNVKFNHFDKFVDKLHEITNRDYKFNELLYYPDTMDYYIKIHIKRSENSDTLEVIGRTTKCYYDAGTKLSRVKRFSVMERNSEEILKQEDGDYLINFNAPSGIQFMIMLEDLMEVVDELKFVKECLSQYNKNV